ncbi:6-hydroxymethylpterin diphosphokinase MptE-like protein [Paenibacillus sp. 1001270B_150601_E10]|uniref:motility associated factor glycosyltransferase family protein n=1 Tax=Paenibacillus sp. 1001270B_150601_E10 TaxID=2787079 RepID=UPI001E459AB9|nr:6-hydroxymethylpterin diphosphokinase MptE-like protein [Paenibacillus sp. 1001270B_150601_E10]
MNIKDINNNFLDKEYPNLNSVVVEEKYIPTHYQCVMNNDGSTNMKISKEKREYYLYSRYNLKNEIERWLKVIEDKVKDSECVFVYGLGFGHHLEALQNRYPDKKYYVYEPDRYIFSTAINVNDLTNVLGRKNIATLAVGDDELTRINFIKFMLTQAKDSFIQLIVPSYQQIYSQELNELNSVLTELVVQERTNISTLHSYSKLWIFNILNNLRYVDKSPGLQHFKGKFKSVPCIIIGSGPSLKYDIELIKELKNKVLIIAAGTSTQALLRANIEPDIIVSMDATTANLKAFSHINTTDIPIVFGTTVHPEILSAKNKYLSYAILNTDTITPYYVGENNTCPIFRMNYSVTGLGIQLAAYLGCSQVIFTGQDLSFPNEEYYASGVEHATKEQINKTLRESNRKVVNVYGMYNNSNSVMQATLQDIGRLLSEYPDILFMNSSQHGAAIDNTTFKKLCDLNLHNLPKQQDHWVKRIFEEVKAVHYKSDSNMKLKLESDKNGISKLKFIITKLQDEISKSGIQYKNVKDQDKQFKIINKWWSQLWDNEIFKRYGIIGLNASINAHQRNFKMLATEENISSKLQMVDRYISPFIKQVFTFIVILEGMLEEVNSNWNNEIN